MKKIIAALLIVTTAAMSGCASNMSSRDYSQATAMQKMKVELGVVDSVRDVKINGKPSPIGGMAGGGSSQVRAEERDEYRAHFSPDKPRRAGGVYAGVSVDGVRQRGE